MRSLRYWPTVAAVAAFYVVIAGTGGRGDNCNQNCKMIETWCTGSNAGACVVANNGNPAACNKYDMGMSCAQCSGTAGWCDQGGQAGMVCKTTKNMMLNWTQFKNCTTPCNGHGTIQTEAPSLQI